MESRIKTFKCKLTSKSGKIIIQYKDGESESDIINSFIGSEFIPLEIKPVTASKFRTSSNKAKKEVLEFTQIMDQLISSGLSLKDSLEVLTMISSKKNDKKNLATTILNEIKKGTSFATVIKNLNTIFPPIYSGIINVGDKIGSVEKIFPRLRSYLETQKKIKDKILNALLYPILVLITAFFAFLTMIFFVFPKLKTMFAEFGGEAAIKLEQNITQFQIVLIFLVVVIFFLTLVIMFINILSKSNQDLCLLKDSLLLYLPIIGKFVTYRETLNFAFAMETLTSSGITIENAINESLSVISNTAYKNALIIVNSEVIKGESLSESFSKHKEFPDYLTKWMLVGEKSGKPDQIFSQIREYFQNQIDVFTSRFMSLLEPALILLVGAFLIILIITVILPVFSLYGDIL